MCAINTIHCRDDGSTGADARRIPIPSSVQQPLQHVSESLSIFQADLVGWGEPEQATHDYDNNMGNN